MSTCVGFVIEKLLNIIDSLDNRLGFWYVPLQISLFITKISQSGIKSQLRSDIYREGNETLNPYEEMTLSISHKFICFIAICYCHLFLVNSHTFFMGRSSPNSLTGGQSCVGCFLWSRCTVSRYRLSVHFHHSSKQTYIGNA
jgi:hypothetical protein